MKKLLFLSLAALFFSCKKEVPGPTQFTVLAYKINNFGKDKNGKQNIFTMIGLDSPTNSFLDKQVNGQTTIVVNEKLSIEDGLQIHLMEVRMTPFENSTYVFEKDLKNLYRTYEKPTSVKYTNSSGLDIDVLLEY